MTDASIISPLQEAWDDWQRMLLVEISHPRLADDVCWLAEKKQSHELLVELMEAADGA